MTTMPRSVAAATSRLSTPMPARPMTLRSPAASSSSAVTFVAERTASPSDPGKRRCNSAAPSPVATSASMPRAVRISTARGLSSSAINTFGIRNSGNERINTGDVGVSPSRQSNKFATAPVRDASDPSAVRRCFVTSGGFGGLALLLPGPVEPRQKRLDIAPLHRRAGPDADAGGRGAVAGEIVAGALGFEPGGHRPHSRKPRLVRQAEEPGLDDFELRRGAGAGHRVFREKAQPGGALLPGGNRGEVALGARDQPVEPARRLGPAQ